MTQKSVKTSYIVVWNSFDAILGCFGNFQNIRKRFINTEKVLINWEKVKLSQIAMRPPSDANFQKRIRIAKLFKHPETIIIYDFDLFWSFTVSLGTI